MKNLRSPKLYIQVYDEIKNYIYQNSLKPGDKLPTEMEMCQQLGVSRNVLREAIKALEITGIVRSTPGVGIVIQEFNPDYLCNSLIYASNGDPGELLSQFSEIRRVLELGFSEEVFHRITPEDLKLLNQQLDVMRSIADENTTRSVATFGVKFAEADAAFHRILYSKMEMPLLISLIDAFWAFDKIYQAPASQNYMIFVLKKHVRIVDALEAQDYQAFYNALEFHYKVDFRPTDRLGFGMNNAEAAE